MNEESQFLFCIHCISDVINCFLCFCAWDTPETSSPRKSPEIFLFISPRTIHPNSQLILYRYNVSALGSSLETWRNKKTDASQTGYFPLFAESNYGKGTFSPISLSGFNG